MLSTCILQRDGWGGVTATQGPCLGGNNIAPSLCSSFQAALLVAATAFKHHPPSPPPPSPPPPHRPMHEHTNCPQSKDGEERKENEAWGARPREAYKKQKGERLAGPGVKMLLLAQVCTLFWMGRRGGEACSSWVVLTLKLLNKKEIHHVHTWERSHCVGRLPRKHSNAPTPQHYLKCLIPR